MADKRVSKPREELLRDLFGLFEKRAYWNFVQLQKETHQPTAHLKVWPGVGRRLWEACRGWEAHTVCAPCTTFPTCRSCSRPRTALCSHPGAAGRLQAVLGEIAVLAKNGPYKGMWSLKKECRAGQQQSGSNSQAD